VARAAAQHGRVDRRHPPAQRRHALGADRRLDPDPDRRGQARLGRQEDADGGQVLLGDAHARGGELAQVERARRLEQDARAVAGAPVGAAGAAVLHRAHRREREPHDVVRRAVGEVGQETDPASVVLIVVVHASLHYMTNADALSSDKWRNAVPE
jgi:hypothetical protein